MKKSRPVVRDAEREAEILRKIQRILDSSGGGLGDRDGRRLRDFDESEFERQSLGSFEECNLVGFQFNKDDECREVKEVECYAVNVTKYRTELKDRCTSVVDQKCGLVTLQVLSFILEAISVIH